MKHHVTLIIATYGRGPAIQDTLESVLAQTRPADEVLVVDDGCPVHTGDFVERTFAGRVRVLRKPNGGTSSARNAGAAAASGDLLAFIDHDDLLEPQGLANLLEGVEACADAHAWFGDHVYLDTRSGQRLENHHQLMPQFRRLYETPHRSRGAWRLYDRELYLAQLRGNLLQQPWLVRRGAFEAVGGFDPEIRYCEDWDLYTRICQRFQVAQTDQILSVHRVEGGNLHLVDGQDQMHVKVLSKWLGGANDMGVRSVLRKRLAQYHKGWGDAATTLSQRRAFYRRAAKYWPFDPVILGRALGVLGWKDR